MVWEHRNLSQRDKLFLKVKNPDVQTNINKGAVQSPDAARLDFLKRKKSWKEKDWPEARAGVSHLHKVWHIVGTFYMWFAAVLVDDI